MEDRHRDAIQRNFTSLVEQTDLELMVTALHEKGVFSDVMTERYMLDKNEDQRTLKRHLYMDVQRRGPRAFELLIEALTETGYWDLVRYLDPENSLHPRERPNGLTEKNFVSLKKPDKKESLQHQSRNDPSTSREVQAAPNVPASEQSDDNPVRPSVTVKKSTHFVKEGNGLEVYDTCGSQEQRGVIIMFCYTEYKNNSDVPRPGAEADVDRLKHIFKEIGFQVLTYMNLDRPSTLQTLSAEWLKRVLVDVQSVFIVISSHGYPNEKKFDSDFRCSDGNLVSLYEVIENFNNKNFPQLCSIPKVFIFQMCRGNREWEEWDAPTKLRMPNRERDASAAGGGGERRGAAALPPPPAAPPAPASPPQRLYSDMLIAHSTLPAFVSHRDPRHGSWYLQALCDVFAEHAHHHHVETLLTLVDRDLQRRFNVQTSSVDKWGFNKLLYLHPGLFADRPHS